MRMLLGVVLALLLAGWIGTLIARDPGYVLIAWDHWSLETSIWFALLLAVAALLLLRGLMLVASVLFGSRTGLRDWNRRRLELRARRRTTRGLLALAEGDFERAERILERSAQRVDTPLINYLGAAPAAHERGNMEDRDRFLQRALDSTPRATLAVGITQAELQISGHQWEQALATLLTLRREAPRNTHVLRMLRATYEILEDWSGLLELIPDLKRSELISGDEVEALERRTWGAELKRAARIEGTVEERLQSLERARERMPRRLRRDPELVESRARALLELGADERAESLLRSALRRTWHEPLVELYGRITGADAERQLVTARSWLSERPNSDVLLLALGRLTLRAGNRTRAREYLEASVRLHRSAAAHAELGRLHAWLGEHEKASECFLESLRLQPELVPAMMQEGVGSDC
jgi:HemY protein